MSDCPSHSLVKMTSARVSELAHATIAWAKSEREKALLPFDQDIASEISRRANIKRRWFRPDPSRQAVVSALARADWEWGWKYSRAQSLHQQIEQVARCLLLAIKEADEIYLSVDDLATLS